ncbi:hypothetical protein [Flavobacterium sp. PL02]|uniref:hypothetical protein n=1 Tax=Flavobacterium sp. PL02 TaxID=3088354 RepID=UPI002B234941|nr:hypothetical protein [Flavobacterium sp. PL02]MEA9412106.1 hypothetical protein [Flavobacterium sp. PL02]
MSRIRIVGGTITKTTVGDHNIYSEGNIVYNSGKAITETSDVGISYGEPKDAPPPEKIAKCLVEYRPCKDWKGEFGIDWPRKKDSKMAVDVPYNGIIGKYGATYGSEPTAIFTPENKAYLNHLNQYSFFNCYKGKYYIPNVTLMKGQTAFFDVITEVEEEPEKLHYVYDTAVFELTILKKLTSTKGKHYDEKALKIKCLKQFDKKQSIRIIATKKKYLEKVGEIFILPNNNVKEIKILFIPVSHNGIKGSIKGNEVQILGNALNQSYIKGDIKSMKEIKVGGWWYDLFFTSKDKKGNKVMDTSNVKSIHKTLDEVFFENEENEIYKDCYRLYMLPNGKLNGIAENVGGNSRVAVVYQNRNDSTAPHELMHAMGLYHTFDNDGLFTYKFCKTDNIMDYTHQIGKARFSTNKWQWKILNSSIR